MDEEAVYVRRADVVDVEGIEALCAGFHATLSQRFGEVDITAEIERAVLSITAHKESGEIVGFASFYDFPRNIPRDSLPRSKWEEWFAAAYPQATCNARNSVWLSVIVTDRGHQYEVMSEILSGAFSTMTRIDSILLPVAAHVPSFAPLNEAFEPLAPSIPATLVQPAGDSAPGIAIDAPDSVSVGSESARPSTARTNSTTDGDVLDEHLAWDGSELVFTPPDLSNEWRVEVCGRALAVPKLSVRLAHVEDNDDLAPVFDSQSEVLLEKYGEFFLADLIENQSEASKAIVAEVNGLACGLMALTAHVDVTLLLECFELEPFDELLRPLNGPRFVPSESESDEEFGGGEEEGEGEGDDNDALDIQLDLGSSVGSNGGNANNLSAKTGGNNSSMLNVSDEKGMSRHPSQVSVRSNMSLQKSPSGVDEESEEVELAIDAFAISLFALDEQYESRAVDFLEAAFECFPLLNYCVMTLPHDAAEPALLSAFQRIPPRPESTFAHTLYIVHRYSLLSPAARICVRPAENRDSRFIERLLMGVEGANEMLDTYDDVMRLHSQARLSKKRREEIAALPQHVYVAEFMEQIIGFVLLSDDVAVNSLSTDFDLSEFVALPYHRNREHGLLQAAVINPIFAPHSRYILQELMRVSAKSCVYYTSPPHSPLPPVVLDFVQLRPRRNLEYFHPNDKLNRTPAEHAAFLFTRKFVHEPKLLVNSRIVVVGASDVGLGMIESLLLIPYLRFTAITLVSSGNLPMGDDRSLSSPDEEFVRVSDIYTNAALARLGMEKTVHMVKEKLLIIDRDERAIVLSDGSVLPYELLVLTTGRGFVIPEDVGGEEVPGVFTLNTADDMDDLAAYVRELVGSGDSDALRAVVYGSTVEAFSTVQGLLQVGAPPASISLVLPPAKTPSDSCFGEFHVDRTCVDVLERAGVKIVKDLTLVGAEEDPTRGVLGAAVFIEQPDVVEDGDSTSEPEPIHMPASCLIYAAERSVDPWAFRAINDACLVYDGRLVVSNTFSTIDERIFASGPLTKFGNKYRTDMRLEAYNAQEVGALLAQAVKAKLDPIDVPLPPGEYDLPPLSRPKIVSAVLPGPQHYFHFHDPRTWVSADDQQESEYTLVTKKNARYCRVYVGGPGGKISSLTYLGRSPPPAENLLALYNLPESYANNLLSRFREGLIDDLIGFFEGPWASGVLHDRFAGFKGELLNEVLTSPAMAEAVDALASVVGDGAEIDEELLQKVKESMLEGLVKPHVQRRVTQFVWENKERLPMYHMPGGHLEAVRADVRPKLAGL